MRALSKKQAGNAGIGYVDSSRRLGSGRCRGVLIANVDIREPIRVEWRQIMRGALDSVPKLGI